VDQKRARPPLLPWQLTSKHPLYPSDHINGFTLYSLIFVSDKCLTYFCHDIFKCHELSSSVLLKSKKRKEAIKREKLAAASSWGLHIRACSLNRRRVRVQGLYNTCCHLELLPTPRGSRRGLEDSRSPELSLHGNNPFGP